MAIQVKQRLVPSSKYKIKCPYIMEAEYITFHNTANDASAENEITYMLNNNNETSYHFAIDDKEVIQGVPLNRNAWHCGDGGGKGNRKSIGIEVCYSKSGGERYKKAEDLAIRFIAQLLHDRGWGINKVKKHQDWSGKYCPHRVLAEGRWDNVLNAIQKELNKLKKPTPSKPKQPQEKVNLVSEYYNHDSSGQKMVEDFLKSKKYYYETYTLTVALKTGWFHPDSEALKELEAFMKSKGWNYEIVPDRVGIKTGWYNEGSEGLEEVEKFFKGKKLKYKKEKA
jgi:N-acetylmuramoyl-L-alanine amidase CwlA